ncbi:hypothetical protein B0T11DRAFT_290370 [Plectosphaerella cucumerina]|uniref:CCHC-type domain-containing protein n=1 Tax=Plectosphaerella cucumerina TaxID=40658 RepID=A0A8K0T6N7_9PEZI|nr:hypothetical protein B0T11DRAFT_290370 [Plectosphaerella cucumerina]
MASKDLAPETPPSRGISSRLLTMKFMQRAVAAGSAQNSPQSEPSSTKRRKTDSPLTGEFHSFDESAIQAAMKQQEAIRQAALAKHQADLGDTPWVLSGFSSGARPTKPQGVTYVTFGSIDAVDAVEGAAQPTKIGRRKVGDFKSKNDEKVTIKREESEDDDSSSEDSSDDSDAEEQTPARKTIKKERTPKVTPEAARARDLRDKRKKPINLNRLSSISGGASAARSGGGLSGGGARKTESNIECYRCGNLGHMAAKCPSASKKRRSMD